MSVPGLEASRLPEEPFPDFSRIYDAYHGKVRAYAAKMLGRDEAEDVAQEVFVKIDRSLGSLSDPSKVSSWVFAITLNAVRDAARKRSGSLARFPASLDGALGDEKRGSVLSGVPDTGTRSPEETAIRNEMVACYLDYVDQLPPAYREVFVLSELDHLASEVIARRLSLSLGTVKIRLHRARARLQGELRSHCRCYFNERGEVMGTASGPKPSKEPEE
jgi:RNA polymerase sigma-70 factor (ECF subfamily)